MKKIIVLSLFMTFLLVPFGIFAQRVGGGDLTFKPKNAAPVVFSHETHVNGKGLKCVGCHYQISQMAQGSYRMDLAKINKDDFCGKCHNGQKSFDVKDPKNCQRCHK